MRRYQVVVGLLLAVMLAACQAAKGGDAGVSDAVGTACKEPRPQMCTMDFRPVCGVLKNGERKAYANGCGACSDNKVVSFVEGECE